MKNSQMKKKVSSIFILLFLLLPNVLAGIGEDLDYFSIELENKFQEFSENRTGIIIMGKYASSTEKLSLNLVKKKYPDIAVYKEYDENNVPAYNPDESVVVLIGGPYQNSLTNEILKDEAFSSEVDEISFAVISFLKKNDQKIIIFSDYAGYNNIPKTASQSSPLSKYIPIQYVPAAATLIGLSLIWLWKILIALGHKIIRFKVASWIEKWFKKKDLKEKYRGTTIFGIRLKVREWIAIFFAAITFAAVMAYTHFTTSEVFMTLIIINITTNFIIYALRHLVRLYLDRNTKLHTEYVFWYWGAFITLVSGWLGNTIPMAGYIVSDDSEKSKEHAGYMAYWVNLLTFIAAIIFYILNRINPSVVNQMSMILSVSIAFTYMLPMKPFSGKNIYKWNKIAWWLTFIPLTLFYVVLNL